MTMWHLWYDTFPHFLLCSKSKIKENENEIKWNDLAILPSHDRSQHPTCGKQNDQSTETESSISGSEYIYMCSCYRYTKNGLKCEMQTCDVRPTQW